MMYDRSVESSPSGTARTATARRPAKVTKKTNAQAATGGSANANPQKKKKPQNKYEPDVPMTKEAAAAWRREQRRKRNRESAAKSRQRQRDRTVELEAELGEWKAKFSAVMDRLNAAEAARGIVPSTPSDLPISEEIRVESGTGSTDTTNGTTVPTDPPAAAPHQGSPSTSNETQQQQHHLIETISRPAVKITGDASSLSPTSSALYLPDAATSMTMMPAADDEGPPALVAASPAVPDDFLSALPDVVESAVGFEDASDFKDPALFEIAPVPPTGADCAAEILDVIDLPGVADVADLPFLAAGDNELGDFLEPI